MKSLLFVTVLAVAAGYCYAADGVKFIARTETKSLYIVTKGVTGDVARATCEANDLISGALENARENDAISAYLRERTAANESVVHAWLGGTVEDSGKSWYWNYSKKPIGPYNNWSDNASTPNKYYQCIYMSPSGEWQATYCELTALPVCQQIF